MRILIFLCFFLQIPFTQAALPEGIWYADQVVPDDGSYGPYYKGWLFISEKEIDQITVLGDHYAKTKFQIASNNDTSAEIRDPEVGTPRKVFFQQQNDTLVFGFQEGKGPQYRKVARAPEFKTPPSFHPRIQVSSKWCVDQDCVELWHSDYQSERLCNLSEGFLPGGSWVYRGPEEFVRKYGLELNLTSFSYRLENDGTQLSSFSTSLFLIAKHKTQSNVLMKSGVLLLKEGLLTRLTGDSGDRKVSVEISIHRR